MLANVVKKTNKHRKHNYPARACAKGLTRGWSPLKIVPPGPNIAAMPGPPPAADGPALVMVFRASVEAEKWARKDETNYEVSLRLSFRGELNNGTLCIRVCSVRSHDSSGIALNSATHAESLGR